VLAIVTLVVDDDFNNRGSGTPVRAARFESVSNENSVTSKHRGVRLELNDVPCFGVFSPLCE